MNQGAPTFDVDPFRLTPDSRFRFLHSSYARTKATVEYALDNDILITLVTGAPGTGKSLLIDDLFSSLDSKAFLVAVVMSTRLESGELLQILAKQFGLEGGDTEIGPLRETLEAYLMEQAEQGRKALLVIDEAHLLNREALEAIAPLCEKQFDGRPLLQIFCFGREDLRGLLFGDGGGPFSEERLMVAHLEPMQADETGKYIRHRLRVAGWRSDPELDEAIYPLVHSVTKGVPRLVNHLMGRLLLLGRIEGRHRLDEGDMRTVIEEVRDEGLLSIASEPLPAEAGSNLGGEEGSGGLAESRVTEVPSPARETPGQPHGVGAPPAEPSLPGSSVPEESSAGKTVESGEGSSRHWLRYAVAGLFLILALVLVWTGSLRDYFGRTFSSSGPEVTREKGASISSPREEVTLGHEASPPPGPRLAQRAAPPPPMDGVKPGEIAKGGPVAERASQTVRPGRTDRPGNVSGEGIQRMREPATSKAGGPHPQGSPGEVRPGPPARVTKTHVSVPVKSVPAQVKGIPEKKASSPPSHARPVAGAGGARREKEGPSAAMVAGNEERKRPGHEANVSKTAPVQPQKKDARTPPRRDAARRNESEASRAGTRPKRQPVKKKTPKERLLSRAWLSRGKPAMLLPSAANVCSDRGDAVTCVSAERTTVTKRGTVAYKVKTVLSGFTPDGGFQVDYRTMVALVDENDLSARKWQVSDHHMACRLVGSRTVRCRDAKKGVREYRAR